MKSKNAEIRRAVRQREQIEKQIRRLILDDIRQCKPQLILDKDRYLSIVWKSDGTEFVVSDPICMSAIEDHYEIKLDTNAKEKLFSKLLRLVNGGAQ